MAGVYLVNVLDVARSLGINPTRVTPEMVIVLAIFAAIESVVDRFKVRRVRR